MFKKLLIANRGEIACRIIKTAKSLGISTVAVYSAADVRALHVDLADEAVPIGPAPALQSYLSVERIMEACLQTGAEAVHPGYGFLSEQADFAEALTSKDIVFIGPNTRAIRAMGDKIESKKLAVAAQITTVPGYIGIVSDAAQALSIAETIGYPVMIKASAGGGGKGMRIAHSPPDVKEGFERARAEAASSFGDDRLFVEKYIPDPRHIEIQVLGDKHGTVIHLAERECSIQRRNQKIIEEAPSAFLDEATRQAMSGQAVRLAKSVGYDSAGTVEFIVGQDRSFYFLEMNTRLQVEHPVTELVTGIDLVEQMIRVAAGEPLKLKQGDVRLKGWAVECRIYAEDPYRGFMPSSGRLKSFRPPQANLTPPGPTLRLDTGVYEGGEIPVHYDPMIAKLVTHARGRSEAIDAMAEALDIFHINGIRHNIPFLSAVMNNERWRKGELSTGFVETEFPGGFSGSAIDNELKRKLSAVAAAIDYLENERRQKISGQLDGRRLESFRHRVVKLGDETHEFEIARNPKGLVVMHRPSNSEFIIQARWAPGRPLWQGMVNGARLSLQIERLPSGYRLLHRGTSLEVLVQSKREAHLTSLIPVRISQRASKDLRCPMPGVVVEIPVRGGQEVKAGDTLAVIEAMKMQNILRAERDGKVKRVCVLPGDTLAFDSVIIEFE